MARPSIAASYQQSHSSRLRGLPEDRCKTPRTSPLVHRARLVRPVDADHGAATTRPGQFRCVVGITALPGHVLDVRPEQPATIADLAFKNDFVPAAPRSRWAVSPR